MKPGFGIRHATCFASLLVLLFLACGAPAAISQDAGAADESAKKWTYDEIKNAPEKARARRNPFANDSDATLAGGKLFGRHCAECHGLKAEGGSTRQVCCGTKSRKPATAHSSGS
jgi:cytochrome c5